MPILRSTVLKGTGRLSATKLSVIAVIVLGSLFVFHREYDGFRFRASTPSVPSVPYAPTHTKGEATCPVSEWIKGEWVPKKNYTFGPLVNKDNVEEVYPMAGFKTCASNRQRDW